MHIHLYTHKHSPTPIYVWHAIKFVANNGTRKFRTFTLDPLIIIALNTSQQFHKFFSGILLVSALCIRSVLLRILMSFQNLVAFQTIICNISQLISVIKARSNWQISGLCMTIQNINLFENSVKQQIRLFRKDCVMLTSPDLHLETHSPFVSLHKCKYNEKQKTKREMK